VVFIVERYVSGTSEADLERMFERLRRVTRELRAEGVRIRYLGSTFVPDDEACFCQFEAPSEEAVATANRRADAPSDRIVSGVRVRAATPRKGER